MNNKYLFFLPALLLVACGDKAVTTTPEYKPLREAVYASAIVKADNQYQVFAASSGILERKLVEEDDLVKRGDALLHISSEKNDHQVSDAAARLRLARENKDDASPVLAELQWAISNAHLKMQEDSADLKRFERLREQNATSANELDKRRLAYNMSLNNYKAAQEQYRSTLRRLETEYQHALNQYKISAASKNDYLVTSKIDGRMYAFYKEEGEYVTFQEPIALLGDATEFLLELEVDELDIRKVKPGQQLFYTLDIVEGAIYEAEVTRIYPLLDQRTQTFRVEARMKTRPDVLYPFLTAEANIVIAERERALVIPKTFLVNGDKVVTDSGETLPVETGISSMEYVEIVSGLDTNTVLVKK